jgi:hypothetical protein
MFLKNPKNHLNLNFLKNHLMFLKNLNFLKNLSYR